MHRFSIVVVLGLLGCGKHAGDNQQQGTSLLASPTACTSLGQCAAGEVCSSGFCAPPAPVSSSYVACSLDADCAPKDYCSLGACAHDCVQDADCTSGLVCTSRGRCVAKTDVASAQPIVTPASPSLVVSAQALRFERGVAEQTLTLQSTGGAAIQYRILSTGGWLSAEPSSGEIAAVPVAVTVKVDRSAAAVPDHGQLYVNSTGGSVILDVFVARDLGGAYSGVVKLNSPQDLAESSLTVDLTQVANGSLSGFVDPQASMLFPTRAAVSGTVDGDGVELSFVIGQVAQVSNYPWLARDVRRTVVLKGNASGVGRLTGTIHEAIAGVLQTDILVDGSFELQRTGAAQAGQANPVPALHLQPVASPFSTESYPKCTALCGTAAACLAAAAPFYDWFDQFIAASSGSPFDNLAAAGAIDGAKLRCAQFLYANALLASPKDANQSKKVYSTPSRCPPTMRFSSGIRRWSML